MDGVKVQLQALINPALDEDEWSTSHPGHFTPGKSPTVLI
jgi:hypothetical protein